jgi:ribonuclease HI
MSIENTINIYTDGSSLSHPRKGGIGIRIVFINEEGLDEIKDVTLPGYLGATNNQMELLACTKGIEEAKKLTVYNAFECIAIHTDSQYVYNNYNNAIYQWSTNKWCNYYGKPIENAIFWKDLIRTIKNCRKRVYIFWVKGHSKNQHNRAADKLAKQSAKNAINSPLNIIKVRRKLSNNSVVTGCVQMLNQRISIRIINDEYLKVHKCYKYKYEVISKNSPYFKCVDIAYSKILLNAGHCYSIRFNDNQHNPTIIKCFKEMS